MEKQQFEDVYLVVVSNICYFYPYLGRIPIWTNIFQTSWNHQLEYISLKFSKFPASHVSFSEKQIERRTRELPKYPKWSPLNDAPPKKTKKDKSFLIWGTIPISKFADDVYILYTYIYIHTCELMRFHQIWSFFPAGNGAISDVPQEKLTFPKSTWYEKFSLRAPRSRLQGLLEEKRHPGSCTWMSQEVSKWFVSWL